MRSLRSPLLAAALAAFALVAQSCDEPLCACPPMLPTLDGTYRGVTTNADTLVLELRQDQGDTTIAGAGVVLRPDGAGAGVRLPLTVTGHTDFLLRNVTLTLLGWYDAPVVLVGGRVLGSSTPGIVRLRYHRGDLEPDSVTVELRKQ